MKRFIILVSISSIILYCANSQTQSSHQDTVRLMSFNIHHGEGIDIKRIEKSY